MNVPMRNRFKKFLILSCIFFIFLLFGTAAHAALSIGEIDDQSINEDKNLALNISVVITSYSIHYTKLYEISRRNRLRL